jgi:hypothetical protein
MLGNAQEAAAALQHFEHLAQTAHHVPRVDQAFAIFGSGVLAIRRGHLAEDTLLPVFTNVFTPP